MTQQPTQPNAMTMTRVERAKALSKIVSATAARESAARNAAELARLQAKRPPNKKQIAAMIAAEIERQTNNG